MRVFAGLALLLAVCAAVPAQAEIQPSTSSRMFLARFNRLDTDNDGAISPDELRVLGNRRAADALFALLALRGDGRIRLSDVARRGNAALLSRLSAYDVDHDGVVLRREFPNYFDPPLAAALDRDGDLRLSRHELRPAFAAAPSARPAPQAGPRPAAAASLPLCWVPVVGGHGSRLQMPVPFSAGRCRVQ
jgi:Ca2+-binding EF-hand superfamily protein